MHALLLKDVFKADRRADELEPGEGIVVLGGKGGEDAETYAVVF
jgi:hypothetical protein